MRVAALLLCLSLLPGGVLLAAAPQAPSTSRAIGDVPPIVLAGMRSYKQDGPDEAMRVWMHGSPLENSEQSASQVQVLHNMQTTFGAYLGFDVVRTQNVSPTTEVLYLAINYDRGPLFARFVMYRGNLGWLVSALSFDMNVDSVLPSVP